MWLKSSSCHLQEAFCPNALFIFLRDGPSVSLELGQQLWGEGTHKRGFVWWRKQGGADTAQLSAATFGQARAFGAKLWGKQQKQMWPKGLIRPEPRGSRGPCWRGRVNHTAAAAPCRQTSVSQTHQALRSCLIPLPFHRNWQLDSWALIPGLWSRLRTFAGKGRGSFCNAALRTHTQRPSCRWGCGKAPSQQPEPLEGIQKQNSRLYVGIEHDTMY